MPKLSHSYSSIKLFENCPLRYYAQRVEKSVKDEGHEASIHGDRIHKSIEAKLRNNDELPQDMGSYAPYVDAVVRSVGNGELLIEHEITVTNRLQPTGWWDADAWLRSKLDVLLLKGPDANVMDWKTGKRRTDMFQMQLFAAQVFLRYPEVETCSTTLVWFKDKKLDTEVFKREQGKALWADVLSRITRIEKALEFNNWPARPSGLCPYCPKFNTCDYARR